MNDPTVNSPIGVRPDYNDIQCDDVMPRVGTDSEGSGLNKFLQIEIKFLKKSVRRALIRFASMALVNQLGSM